MEKIKVLLDSITAIYQQFKKDKAERRESQLIGSQVFQVFQVLKLTLSAVCRSAVQRGADPQV